MTDTTEQKEQGGEKEQNKIKAEKRKRKTLPVILWLYLSSALKALMFYFELNLLASSSDSSAFDNQ